MVQGRGIERMIGEKWLAMTSVKYLMCWLGRESIMKLSNCVDNELSSGAVTLQIIYGVK